MKTFIVIPAYNENNNIGRVVARAKNYGEVVVVDDGSVIEIQKFGTQIATNLPQMDTNYESDDEEIKHEADGKTEEKKNGKSWSANILIGIVDAIFVMIIIAGYRQKRRARNQKIEEEKDN